MLHYIDKTFQKVVDSYHAIHPRKPADIEILKQAKLISHRGEHDNKTIFENTLAAFEKVHKEGVWGVEFDIRWTKDLVPMVFHDKDLMRLFKCELVLQETNFKELRRAFPVIPSLEEVVNNYGNKMHLMIELKKEDYPHPESQSFMLEQILRNLEPTVNFHFIALHPEMFNFINFVPSQCFLPIAYTSYKKFSKAAFRSRYGGVLGHYQFLSKKRIERHLEKGHKVGVGYVSSKNSLYRELNRGVEWLFSNHACYMQRLLNKLVLKYQAE